MAEMLLGSLEAGGTKMVMGIADRSLRVLKSAAVPTRGPEETLAEIIAFFRQGPVAALGIASFGPVDLKKDSPSYGSITNTPKLAWQHFPLLKTLRDALGVPCAIDTDVNASALAEASLGAAKGLRNCLYLTVGTGIGGGLLCEGQLVHGLIHPEWGHITLARREDDPLTRGICPYHPGCAEGYACGPSIQTRWAAPPSELPDDHRAWDLEAYYLAQICLTAVMTVSPEILLLGGGVMQRSLLYPLVRGHLKTMIGGYLYSERLLDLDSFVRAPALYPDSGLTGGFLLARGALREEGSKGGA